MRIKSLLLFYSDPYFFITLVICLTDSNNFIYRLRKKIYNKGEKEESVEASLGSVSNQILITGKKTELKKFNNQFFFGGREGRKGEKCISGVPFEFIRNFLLHRSRC